MIELCSPQQPLVSRYSQDLYADNGLRPWRPVFEMEVLIKGKQIFPGFGFLIVVF